MANCASLKEAKASSTITYTVRMNM